MSFIGTTLLLKIDLRLREAFPHRQHIPFGGLSIILIGDFAHLLPITRYLLTIDWQSIVTPWHFLSTRKLELCSLVET